MRLNDWVAATRSLPIAFSRRTACKRKLPYDASRGQGSRTLDYLILGARTVYPAINVTGLIDIGLLVSDKIHD